MRQAALVRWILILRGKHQRTVSHGDALARSGQNKTPLRLFHLRRDVDGLGPRLAIVIAANKDELTGLFRLHPGTGAAPRTIAMTPSRRHPNRARVAIDQHGRITDAIVMPLGIAAHVHDRACRLPRLPAIGAARHAHVDVAR